MAQTDPSELLLRARDKVIYTLDRLPSYMSTQTIDRSLYEPVRRQVEAKACDDPQRSEDTKRKLMRISADRVRLDVGMAASGEMYSWVGENRFRNRSLFSIVSEGSLSTGYFNGFLDLVFRSDNASFSYSGEVSEEGRKLMEYTYRQPLEGSHYDFLFHGQAVTTGYEGNVLVDPATAELFRLTLRTSRIPADTGACEVNNIMSYSRFRLNGSDFLLPSETHLHIKGQNGVETENLTVYTGCHEFLGESTLRFDVPPDAPALESAASRTETTIPAGLPFRLSLAQNIQVATAAAGDTVKTVLTTDIQDQAKKVLVPKGTLVLCRILRISRWYGQGGDAGRRRAELLLSLENFALPGDQRPVYALPDRGRSGPAELGPLNSIGRGQWFTTFWGAGDDYVIKSGLASSWVTVAP